MSRRTADLIRRRVGRYAFVVLLALAACEDGARTCGVDPAFVLWPDVPETVQEQRAANYLAAWTTVTDSERQQWRDFAAFAPGFGMVFLPPDQPVTIERHGDVSELLLVRLADRYFTSAKEVSC